MRKLFFLTLLFFTSSVPRIQITFEDVVQQTCIQCGAPLTRADILLAQAFATQEGPLYLCQKCREAQERPWHGSGVQAAIEGIDGTPGSDGGFHPPTWHPGMDTSDEYQLAPLNCYHGPSDLATLNQQERQKLEQEIALINELEAESREIARERAMRNFQRKKREELQRPRRRRWKLPSWRSVVGLFAFWRTNNSETPNSPEPPPPPLALPSAPNPKFAMGDLEADDNSTRKTTYTAEDSQLRVKKGTITLANVKLPGTIREITQFPGTQDEVLIVTDKGIFLHSEAGGLREFSAQESVPQSPEQFLEEQQRLAQQPVTHPQDHEAFLKQQHNYIDVDAPPAERKGPRAEREELVLHPECNGKEQVYLKHKSLTEEEYAALEPPAPPPRNRVRLVPKPPPPLPPRWISENSYIDSNGKVHTSV